MWPRKAPRPQSCRARSGRPCESPGVALSAWCPEHLGSALFRYIWHRQHLAGDKAGKCPDNRIRSGGSCPACRFRDPQPSGQEARWHGMGWPGGPSCPFHRRNRGNLADSPVNPLAGKTCWRGEDRDVQASDAVRPMDCRKSANATFKQTVGCRPISSRRNCCLWLLDFLVGNPFVPTSGFLPIAFNFPDSCEAWQLFRPARCFGRARPE